MKLSYEDKQEIVRLIGEEYLSLSQLVSQFDIQEKTVSDFLLKYQYHGDNSLVKTKSKLFLQI